MLEKYTAQDMITNTLFLLLSVLFFLSCKVKQNLTLVNPTPNWSFEGNPGFGRLGTKLPEGLIDCGFSGETSPDVFDGSDNEFGVVQSPFEGRTYLGMVVRENETWERISIKLDKPLQRNREYSFSIYLCRSPNYEAKRKSSGVFPPTQYTTPCRLRIWGALNECEEVGMLGETDTIKHSEWKEYKFDIIPDSDFSFVILEAFYRDSIPFPYNGNILLDNASGFIEK